MVYKRLLKDDFYRLAPALRKLHDVKTMVRAKGSVTVQHERRWLARLVRFPKAGENIPLDLEVVRAPEGEAWSRYLGHALLRSVQQCEDGLLVEQMGPVRMRFRIFVDAGDLRLELQDARCGWLPVPVRVSAVERGHGPDGWEFEVHVKPIGSYRGVMELLS